MLLRMLAKVLPRQSVSPAISWSMRSDGFILNLYASISACVSCDQGSRVCNRECAPKGATVLVRGIVIGDWRNNVVRTGLRLDRARYRMHPQTSIHPRQSL